MDRLPQEIVAKIAEYLPKEHEGKRVRPALATLSDAWQYAIERCTFESLDITSDDLEDFCAVIASYTTRRRFLQRISVSIILPPYEDEDCASYETADDRAANNLVFSRHVSALLQELSQWPAGGELHLRIDMYSPLDALHRGSDQLLDDEREVAMGTREDLFGERFSNSYISLTQPLTTTVPRVTSFQAPYSRRYLDPGSEIALTAAFPNLERIIWVFKDPTCFLALRRQQMQELTSACTSFQPPSLCKELTMIVDSMWYPHNARLPILNVDGNSLCASIRTMLGRSNIQRFIYEGEIDPTLFWPHESHQTDHTSHWRSLEEIRVTFDPMSWTGQWFFKGPPGSSFDEETSDKPLPQEAPGLLPPGYYDSDEQNEAAIAHAKSMARPWDHEGNTLESSEFRCIPRDEGILPLLTAIARRLAHTPSLQNVNISTRLPSDNGWWFFAYHAPDQESDWDEYVDCKGSGSDDPLSRPRVFLHADGWEPDAEVMALLRGIGRDCHGKDAIVTFLPFLYDFSDDGFS